MNLEITPLELMSLTSSLQRIGNYQGCNFSRKVFLLEAELVNHVKSMEEIRRLPEECEEFVKESFPDGVSEVDLIQRVSDFEGTDESNLLRDKCLSEMSRIREFMHTKTEFNFVHNLNPGDVPENITTNDRFIYHFVVDGGCDGKGSD